MTTGWGSAFGRAAPLAMIGSALVLLGASVSPVHATLRGERDVDRAIEALYDEDDDEVRARAARWLGSYGPDEVVLEALLDAASDEDESIVMTALAEAIARRARASEAEELLELEHRMRAPVRATFAVLLAQLGAEESDAWLVERLSSPAGTELRPALEQVAEIARARR
ncbi:MAG: HEAT repeat domain-containing protein, partial [Deltaproteobacteria bacterium]|nr:HEAT repeat domain-containing protein [Deltaproteobacteria bacterium]